MKALLNNIKENYLLILITVLPLLDILSFFLVDSNFNIITTVIRVIILIFLFILAFIKSQSKKKYYLFVLVIGLYCLGHIISGYTNGYVNFIGDISNLFRIIYMPVLLFSFVDLFQNCKNYEHQIVKGMENAFFIILISLIISLITGTCNYTYPNQIGITGWFYNKNSQSLIISLLTFILVSYNLESKKYYLFLPLVFLLLFFNATKAAYICLLILLIYMLVNLLYKKYIKKTIYTIVFCLLSLFLFNYSPTKINLSKYSDAQIANNTINKNVDIYYENSEENVDIENTSQLSSELIAYQNIYISYGFSPIIEEFGLEQVLDKYNYTKNSFILSNNRTKKKVVAQLVYEQENILSHMFGFEYTKVFLNSSDNAVNNFDLESDITALYYYCGIIGLGLYFSFILYYLCKIIKALLGNLKYIFNVEYTVWILLIFLLIFGSEFSGDLLRRPNANIYLSIIIAMAYTKSMYLINKPANMNSMNSINKLFEKTYKNSKEKYFRIIKKKVLNSTKAFVVTANPEAFMLAEKNEEYMNMLLDDNTTIVPDGIGLVKAGRMLDYDIKERIPGIDIATKLLEYSDKYKKKVYLFGAKEEVIEKMKELMQEKYPSAKLVGTKNGYEKDKDKVFQDIIKKEPDIILVALGMPMQEELIYKYYKDFKKGIFVGVGGSFDVMSGMKKRAPKIFQKLNLEWLYRIVKEPKRLKRFYDNNVKFIFHVRKLKRENN